MAVILIVEDDVFIREMAAMLIQDSGYQTLTSGDAEEALSHLRSDEPIDALFTDIYLKTSVLGGCELALQAVGIRSDLRVLYTTGNAMTDEMRARFVSGARFLSKPYSALQLDDFLEKLLTS